MHAHELSLNTIFFFSDSELVSIDDADELSYIEQRIERLVRSQGQQFGHEQWWTGGSRVTSTSQWEWRDGTLTANNNTFFSDYYFCFSIDVYHAETI